MKGLKISKEISLPRDAVTQTLAVIGRRGSGKTYLSQMIAEQLLDIEAQVVVLDTVGVWWGLRIAEDGKGKGKPIFVIGGDHGDVPIVPEAGKQIAQLIVGKGVSAVIDVSGFGVGEYKRFMADFGEELFHLKKQKRSAMMLMLEEAQLVVPQNIRPDDGRMYSHFEKIVRLGRNYGIGCTIITQRPQSVNKEVLSQVECLCVLQITGPHERKALEAWVQEVGADRKLVGELPGLSRGEGYVWSPQWLKKYERVHFSKKTTFDSSKTPELGEKARAASLSVVDVENLKKDIEDVVRQAEKDDPVALRRRIAELEKPNKEAVDSEHVKKEIRKALDRRDAEWRRMVEGFERKLKIAFQQVWKAKSILPDTFPTFEVIELSPGVPTFIPPKNDIRENMYQVPVVPTPDSKPLQLARHTDQTGLSGPEHRILDSIAWMETIGVSEPEMTAVAFLAGYTVGGGAFNNPRGALKTKGYIRYIGTRLALTEEGRRWAVAPDTALTNEDLHENIYARLPGPEQKLLRVLINKYPDNISNAELAELTGYQAGGGAFNNPRGRLKTLGLIEYPASGRVRASTILFPI